MHHDHVLAGFITEDIRTPLIQWEPVEKRHLRNSVKQDGRIAISHCQDIISNQANARDRIATVKNKLCIHHLCGSALAFRAGKVSAIEAAIVCRRNVIQLPVPDLGVAVFSAPVLA